MQHREFSHLDLSITALELAYKKLCNRNWGFSSKNRSSHGLLYIINGLAKFNYNDEEFYTKASDVVFLKKWSTYNFKSEGEECLEYIIINFQTAEGSDLDEMPLDGLSGSFESAKQLFEQVEELWYYKDIGHIILCKSLLYQIIFMLLHKNVYSMMHGRDYRRVAPAAEYMDNYFDKNITVEQLAKICGMSVTHFRRSFKQIYEAAPMDYLCELRINKAKDFLKTGMYSITEISELVGFNSVYYFSRRFKQITCISPKDFV